MKFKLFKSVILGSVVLPVLAFAQFGSRSGFDLFGSRVRGSASSGYGLCYIIDIMNRFISWAQVILFVVAALMALRAAYVYIVHQGKQGGDKGGGLDARDILMYAAIGVGVALLAYAIVPLVSNFLGVDYADQCF